MKGQLTKQRFDWERRTEGWQMVHLGIAVPRSFVCWCCLAATGLGMNRGTETYCMCCWEPHLAGRPCGHQVQAEPQPLRLVS